MKLRLKKLMPFRDLTQVIFDGEYKLVNSAELKELRVLALLSAYDSHVSENG